MARKIHRYGWTPDIPDQRDFMYAAPAPVQKSLPPLIDLTARCPPVYDQGQLGSCTANAIAGAIEFDQGVEKKSEFGPSRLFIYYNERVIEGTVASDSGAQIRDGIKTVTAQGACHENLWPYDAGQFAQQPPAGCYSDAQAHKAVLYQRLAQQISSLRGCLASGYPFVFGFTVYDSFESDPVAASGIVPMPLSDESVIGGHAVVAVGYDDKAAQFIVRNSWGPDWGRKGYCRMPYAYLTQPSLASDFWTIRTVE
jgi:C1A family cysteine protease